MSEAAAIEIGAQNLARGLDHAAFPTFDPAATVRF
jgi:hypothetical protein